MIVSGDRVIYLGRMGYEECLEIQLNIHKQVALGNQHHAVLVVEHPPTITTGYQSKMDSLKVSLNTLTHKGIQYVPSDRGGDVTAHEPGQLVIYPIINLGLIQNKLVGPKKFVEILEQTIIKWLSDYGVNAHVDQENPGVWILNKKIAAIGIRIKKRTTYHGISINLYNDLATFSCIIPCGLPGKEVTSLQLLTGQKVDLKEVGLMLANNIYNAAILGS
jgi:lipoyl(octanoyl) transferase